MKNFFIIFIFPLALSHFISCSNKTDSVPSKIIPKDKMADVLVDVHLAEASAGNQGLNPAQISLMMAAKYDTLFKKHGINFAQFKSSYDYYLDHPDELSEIYAEVVNRLTTLDSRMSSQRKIKRPPVEMRDTSVKH